MINLVTAYVRDFVFNPDTIDENVRKSLYDYDIKEIPLYENQKDLEINDSFWQISTSPESPDMKTQSISPLPDSTPTPSIPEVAEFSIIACSSLEEPPASLCFAPKERKLDINLSNSIKDSHKTLLFLLFLRSFNVKIILLISFVPCCIA